MRKKTKRRDQRFNFVWHRVGRSSFIFRPLSRWLLWNCEIIILRTIDHFRRFEICSVCQSASNGTPFGKMCQRWSVVRSLPRRKEDYCSINAVIDARDRCFSIFFFFTSFIILLVNVKKNNDRNIFAKIKFSSKFLFFFVGKKKLNLTWF